MTYTKFKKLMISEIASKYNLPLPKVKLMFKDNEDGIKQIHSLGWSDYASLTGIVERIRLH